MSYKNRKTMSYTPRQQLGEAFFESFKPNDRSSEYTLDIIMVRSKIFRSKKILSKLNRKNASKLNLLTSNENKKLLEKNSYIEEIVETMQALNFLLKLLEKSSQYPSTDSHHLILSQPAYKHLREAYLDNPNDDKRKDELWILIEEDFIQVTSASYRIPYVDCIPLSPDIRATPSTILDIIDINSMKNHIISKIDKYKEEVITPWMEEVTHLIAFTEKLYNIIEKHGPNTKMTIGYFDKFSTAQNVKQISSEDLYALINGSSVNSVEQTLSNDDSFSVPHSSNVT